MIVEGVLEKMASGRATSALTGRDYVKVGDTRLRRVLASNYLDGVLEESVGSRITLSVSKSLFVGNQLMAFKDSSGELHKASITQLLIFSFLFRFLLWGFLGFFLCFVVAWILILAAGVAEREMLYKAFVVTLSLYLPVLVAWPSVRLFLDFRARQALG